MPKSARALVALAAVLLLAVYVFPLWRIGLMAPQYPEGLGMRIHVNTVVGATEHDLTNINNLNHYIGMKAIEPDAIPELRYMPWIVAGLIGAALIVAAIGRRRPLYFWTGLFAVVGVVGLADFWRWQYDYGHNLDEASAIIKIPGMSYQPPLIGTKQLLNFTATSLPDIGGIAIGLALLCGTAAVWLTVRASRGTRMRGAATALAIAATACASSELRDIHYGSDSCAYCRMVISDPRFGAKLVTNHGKTITFDSVECLASYALTNDSSAIRSMWVSDFQHPGTFILAEDARFLHGGAKQSPMGLGLTAFSSEIDARGLRRATGGETLDWLAVLALVRHERSTREAGGDGERVIQQHRQDAVAGEAIATAR